MICLKCRKCGEIFSVEAKHLTLGNGVASVKSMLFCPFCVMRYNQNAELPLAVPVEVTPHPLSDGATLPENFNIWNKLTKESLIK